MVFWIASAAGLVIAYLFGSTPTGYLAGKLLKGIDIREHGSKSVGATNVLRTLGKWPALLVLLVDVLKGAAAIVFARWFYPWFHTLPSVTPLRSNNPIVIAFHEWAALGRDLWRARSWGERLACLVGPPAAAPAASIATSTVHDPGQVAGAGAT